MHPGENVESGGTGGWRWGYNLGRLNVAIIGVARSRVIARVAERKNGLWRVRMLRGLLAGVPLPWITLHANAAVKLSDFAVHVTRGSVTTLHPNRLSS